MKRTQVVALVAGVTLGLGGVALGVILARQEGREAARRFIDQYGDLGQKGSQRAMQLAQQARQVGGQVAKTASEQYLPKAKDALNTVRTQAPQAAAALGSALSRSGLNGKQDATEGGE